MITSIIMREIDIIQTLNYLYAIPFAPFNMVIVYL